MLARRLVLLLLALGTACASSGGAAPVEPIRQSTPTPGYWDRAYNSRITLEVGGDVAVTFERETPIRLIEIFGDEVPSNAHFFSVQPDQPLLLEDGRLLRFSADLAPGTYEGPGKTYAMSEAGGTEIDGVQSLGSGAYVELIRADPPLQARYDVFGEPCRFELTADYATGSVQCPRLLDAEGKAVDLRWSWTLLPKGES